MITLYARAIKTQRPDPILSDRKAVKIAEQLDYDFSKYEKGWGAQLGSVLRARSCDRILQNFPTCKFSIDNPVDCGREPPWGRSKQKQEPFTQN